MDDYEQYELDCEKIRRSNEGLLNSFEQFLKSSGLSKKTVNNHLSNIEFYINEYLLYEEAVEAKNGINGVDNFLGYWFIKKAMWASESTLKSNATSLKKFYSFMFEKGLIEIDDLTVLKESIKKGMPEWLESLDRFDNPSTESLW